MNEKEPSATWTNSRDEMEQVERVTTVQSIATRPTKVHVHWKTWIVLLAINLLQFAQVLTVVGSGFMGQDTSAFLGDSSKAVWLTGTLTICSAALNPPIAQAADLWGRKWILVTCSLCGVVGPIVMSRAPNIRILIAGSAILGFAFGAQVLIYAVPSEILPRKYRAWAQASLNVSAATSSIVALLFGGSLLRHGNGANYRIYWYATAGIFFLATLSVTLFYNPPPRELQKSLTTTQKLRKVDWIGALGITSGLTLFCIALQWAGTPYSWADAHVLAPLILSLVLIIAFAVYDWHFKQDGILHHALFQDRDFVLFLAIILCEGLSFFTSNSYFVFEVSVVGAMSIFQAALRLIITFITTVAAAILIGLYITKTKQIREPLVLGFATLLIYNALMTTIRPATSDAHYWGYSALGGIGIGLLSVVGFLGAQQVTPGDLISSATGLSVAARAVGGTICLAINNAIFQHSLKSLSEKVALAVLPKGFPPAGLEALLGALVSGNTEAIAHVPGATPEILQAAGAAVRAAYADAFHYPWIAASCFCALGLILSLLVRSHKDSFTSQIDAPVEAEFANLQGKIELRQRDLEERQQNAAANNDSAV